MILYKSLDSTVLYGITVAAVIVQECSLFRNFQNDLFSVDIFWGLSFFIKERCFTLILTLKQHSLKRMGPNPAFYWQRNICLFQLTYDRQNDYMFVDTSIYRKSNFL